ncbi:CBS domain-containing protein [Candidatus Entotheonella palauensis]|uniref:CBS domain-containing protein n=1 Tax=Candidatus Entotheonella palauensis TaxID=93172 RepID=UPI000B7D0613|nr:CBS domain-containing protein [Candidatus Entotheonella palauensis]
MYVKDYMQAVIMTVSPNDFLSTARHIMDELFIRHLPVVLEGRLAGILTDRDVRQATPSNNERTAREHHDARHEMCVSDVMTRQVYTVSPETALIEAAATFLEQKFDCLPVVDEDRILKGIITVSDFVRIYAEQHESVIF